jgi:hypothetical protein
MPESDAEIQAEGGKRVTITIAELSEAAAADPTTTDPGNDPNTFVIFNGKYRLTITIAE